MEYNISPARMYMLDARLEVLQEQSKEWLNEIAFWRDELKFFNSLFVKKTHNAVPLNAKNNIVKTENDLKQISSGELDELELIVKEHEHFLADLLEGTKGDEKSYREKHRQLSQKFYLFENRIKSLKKEVFNLSKQIDKEKLSFNIA